HSAGADQRAFVDSAIAADQYVVFNDHRGGVNGFEHASYLCGGAQVYALAYLRARAYQSVRVDHRAFIYISAYVDEHGRHADDRWCNVGSFADGRASGHEANAIGQS